MNDSNRRNLGEGERLHAQRRRRFWLIVLGIAVLGLVTGLVSGFIDGSNRLPGATIAPQYAVAAAIGALAAAIVFIFASWRFFANVDEVELADNLWASLVGFYAYAILFPLWWSLWKLGQVREPDDWTIFGAALVISMLFYAARKIRAR